MTFTAEPKADRIDLWTEVSVAGVRYLRLPLHTEWLDETDDLVLALKESLKVARPGDTVGISETVTILLTGRTVDINTVQPGWLARFLARYVRPRGEHARGLSVPEKMQYVIRTVGLRRIIAATIGSAVTRPFGMHGTFYRIAGPIARDVDGGPHTPYEHVLLPPLDTKVAQRICADLERALDIGVSIVDLNDFGGSIRAVSPRSLSAETLAAVLSDNPLGQHRTSTPFVLVRPA
jgi:F420-0:gamma-glutamyl ligase